MSRARRSRRCRTLPSRRHRCRTGGDVYGSRGRFQWFSTRDRLGSDARNRSSLQAYLAQRRLGAEQHLEEFTFNALHSVEKRCSRWLLLTHDRVGADEFPITQEFLSEMLGVRRTSVTVAAGILQSAGFVRYSGGRMTVIDREGLEGSLCECYRIIRGEFDRQLG